MTTVAEKARSAYGDLPENWTSRRLRFDVRLNPKKSALDMKPEELVSFVPMDAVGEHGGLRLYENRELADVYEGYTYFADGDLCIAKITPCFENGKGALAEGLTNGVGFGTTELHVVRPGPGIDRRFLFYISIADDFRKIGESEMYGAGGQKRIDEGFIKDWMPPLPPLKTQRFIAQFLDEKTARIDGLIDKKRALLDRLTEKRQALITRAVTKGLNPNAPIKPSGIDWLGDIPEHWEALRLKNIAKRIVDAEHKTAPSVDTGDYFLVRTSNVRDGQLVRENAKYVDYETYLEWTRRCVPEANDLLLTREAPAGEVCLVPDDLPVCLGQRMVLIKTDRERVLPEYLVQTLAGGIMDEFIASLSQGSTVTHFNMSDIGCIPLLLPPLNEQRKIAVELENSLGQVAVIKARVGRSIDTLEEYRSALITAAVTGQIGELQ